MSRVSIAVGARMKTRTERSARLHPEAGYGVSAVYREQKHRVNDAKVELPR